MKRIGETARHKKVFFLWAGSDDDSSVKRVREECDVMTVPEESLVDDSSVEESP